MARIRKDGTILLNALQFATYNVLLANRDENGVIPAAVVNGYKQNVIKGIVKHGALEWFRKTNLRSPKTPVSVIEQPETVHRTAEPEAEMQLAA